MQARLRALFCPCCGAALPPPTAVVTSCAYCDATLEVAAELVRGQRRESAAPKALVEWPASLRQRTGPAFEMSILTQTAGVAENEIFTAVELSSDRFAVIYLRGADTDGRTVACELPISTLVASLEENGDPGLAANLAAEELSAQGFSERLEVAVALFDPLASNAVLYAAGCRDSLWWMSSEEGRAIAVATNHPALERRMLREQRDYFSNREPLFLSSGDLLLVLSAAYCGRGGGPYASGLNGLTPVINQNLGEDPLRVVTLAKNAFWTGRSPAVREQPPSGPLQVAAVQALPRPLLELDVKPHLQQLGSALFELAVLAHPDDWLELVPLHSERWVLIWASNDGLPVSPEAQRQLHERVLEVLDRRDHGDNENPRRAGRHALEGLATQVTRLNVIQLFDQWGRVKYYRSGWKQPVALGPRPGRDSECAIQQFDEGGEATVPKGGRLFFPGHRSYAGQPFSVRDLAVRWPGGKASLLYRALCDHWKTPPSAMCLTRLARALVSDLPAGRRESAHLGLALVTGRPSPR